MSLKEPVTIIGGGWAGLAAALELTAHDIPVQLYEAAPQLGGRARNAPFGELTVDNGQHLLIGAYSEILRLLALMGVKESEVLQRTRLTLKVIEGEKTLRLRPPPLPAPLHLAAALLMAQGLSTGERLRALWMSLQLQLSGFSLAQDISVASLLREHRQSENITRRLWEPLCIATLNTPIERASAQVFLRVLQDSFSRHRHDADLLLPKVPLGELFPQRAADHLQQHGAMVMTRSRVDALHINQKKLAGLTIGGEFHHCGRAIIATAPHSAARLLAGHDETAALQQLLNSLGSQPITTVYLQYPETHRIDGVMVGMSGTTSQWLFDRHDCGQPGLIAVVISAEGPHDGWDNATLTAHIRQEIRTQFPHWPEPLQSRVIRERRATFDCHTGIEAKRPGNTPPITGLWLAGDYTDTGYPATLEGAVRSGVQCARRIIATTTQSGN